MLLLEAAPISSLLGDSEVVKALIGGLATILVAALGLYGVIRQASKPSRTKPPTTTGPQTLQTFSGTQNEFMALVIADNKTLRENQEGQNRVMEELKETVGEIKEHQDKFVAAVQRYLIRLAAAWGHESTMPWPEEDDFHLLEDTLPIRGHRRRKE